MIRDHLIKGDGGPYFETLQELFEPTEGEKVAGAGKEIQSSSSSLSRAEIKSVMESYCNVRSVQASRGASDAQNPEARSGNKALL